MQAADGAALRGAWVEPARAMLVELGAARTPHSRRTFLEHLTGVAAILQRWGAREAVVKAGLFHSIYGTEVFEPATVGYDQRPRLRALLGDEAERLAYLFCAFERASIYRAIAAAPHRVTLRHDGGGEHEVTRAEAADLLLLVWANDLEQRALVERPPGDDARALRTLERLGGWLPPDVRDELIAAHREPARSAPVKSRLCQLLNVDDAAAFTTDGWMDRVFVAHGPVERLAGLCDHDLDALCRMRTGYTRAFFRTAAGAIKSIDLRSGQGQERAAYEAGATVYFHGLEAPPLAEWLRAIDDELGLVAGLSRISAFASLKGQGLTPHYDLNDNFVCQARGLKRWRLAPNQHVRHPLFGYTVGAPLTPAHKVEAPGGLPDGMPSDGRTVLEMKAGMVAFVPRGMWHDTETTESESLHFNIQCGLPTWRDLIDFVVSRTALPMAADLRAGIPAMFDGAALSPAVAAGLTDRLADVVAALRDGAVRVNRDEFHRYVALRRTRLFEYPY